MIHQFKLYKSHNQINITSITSTKFTKQIAPRLKTPSNQRLRSQNNHLSPINSNPMNNIVWTIHHPCLSPATLPTPTSSSPHSRRHCRRCWPLSYFLWDYSIIMSYMPVNKKETIGSIPLKDPNFRYIPWTPHVIDSCGSTCKWDSNGMDPKWWSFNGMDPNFPIKKHGLVSHVMPSDENTVLFFFLF
jgi:hypothetical protein